MLAVSPLSPTTTTSTKDGCNRDQTAMDSFPSFSAGAEVDFQDFDSIDFDDLFGGDALPYLEMDPEELLADFSLCPSTSAGEEETASAANQVVPSGYNGGGNSSSDEESKKDECNGRSKEEEIQSKKSATSSPVKGKKMNKSHRSSSTNNNEGKRKTKVDWTPDLHRRFVQAVEQLGVDKAVPSRILELMGIDCLTRHNVASHLQKYRSHRKHLLAREAEAANWTQKRQMYGVAVAPPPKGVSTKGINANHQWHGPPTMGFPPPTPPPIHHPHHHNHHHPFRPLHVWGHPTHPVEHQSHMPTWPKPFIPPHPPLLPPHTWAAPLQTHPSPPPTDPSLWHSRHQRIPNAGHPMTPCFPHPLPTTRFGLAPPVPGIPPTHAAMYRTDHHGVGAPATTLQSGLSHPDPLDLHPSKESIDAAIGEVLSKPWLPLPLGLKPPATDSVMGELELQGIPTIPPSCD